jgi:hypothetical protein
MSEFKVGDRVVALYTNDHEERVIKKIDDEAIWFTNGCWINLSSAYGGNGLRPLSDNTEEKEETSSVGTQIFKVETPHDVRVTIIRAEAWIDYGDDRPLSIQEQAFKNKQDALIAENQKLIDANREHRERQSTIIAGLVELPDIPKNGRF